MNKKVKTILFIFGATAFNVLTAIVSFVLLFLFYVNFLAELIPEGGRPWGVFVIFIAALALSFVIYRVVLKFLLTKIDVDKHFDPIFPRRNQKKTGA